MIAPPTPCTARASARNVGSPATPHSSEPAGEDDDADREHDPAAEPVGDRAGREQQRGERQRVGVDDPLQVGEAGAQRLLDVGERDVHDRDVEQEHEDAGADRDQRPPFAVHGGEPPGEWELRPDLKVLLKSLIVK